MTGKLYCAICGDDMTGRTPQSIIRHLVNVHDFCILSEDPEPENIPTMLDLLIEIRDEITNFRRILKPHILKEICEHLAVIRGELIKQ